MLQMKDYQICVIKMLRYKTVRDCVKSQKINRKGRKEGMQSAQ